MKHYTISYEIIAVREKRKKENYFLFVYDTCSNNRQRHNKPTQIKFCLC